MTSACEYYSYEPGYEVPKLFDSFDECIAHCQVSALKNLLPLHNNTHNSNWELDDIGLLVRNSLSVAEVSGDWVFAMRYLILNIAVPKCSLTFLNFVGTRHIYGKKFSTSGHC
ncbi:hypothetical protein RF11_14534 [Thelohanellus kitauei]|uniref:Uncharacterized protein n=1 Tax=Thelohanellus kitauei TaxID=669202 RepID=A0A0C2NB47_THEKT|nr:hypothetical protein RF11_14534 [Thelohanellus kitauei]